MTGIAGKYKICLGLSLLVLLVWYVDFSEISRYFQELVPLWLIAALTSVIAATLVGSFNLHLLVNKNRTITFVKFLPSYWLAWAFSLITPGQVGDIASLPLFLKKQGMSHSQTLGCLLIDKLFSFFVISVLALFGIFFFFESFLKFNNTTIFFTLLCFFVSGSFGVWKRKSIKSFLDLHRLEWVKGVGKMLDDVADTIRHEPHRVLVNFLVTWIKVSLIGLSYWSVFAAFGYTDILFFHVVPLMAASSLVAYLPISFNGLGTVEMTGLILFSVIGLPEPVILSSYILLRILVIFVAWGPVLVWLLFGGNLSANKR